MKPIRQFIILILALVTTLASAQTNAPSEQFQSAVAAFQQSATEDNARKLAELLKQLDPPPALPEEAEFHAMKGAAFFNQATNAATDGAIFAKAAAEYRAASTAAPWFGDYHHNLAAAENSAGRFDAAANALKFAQIFARTDQDRRDNLALRAKIETTQEIAATRKVAAEKAKGDLAAKQQEAAKAAAAEKERLRPTVEGKWSSGVTDFQVVRNGDRFTLTAVEVLGQKAYGKDVVIDQLHVRFLAVYSEKGIIDLTLSTNGNELNGRQGSNESATFKRVP